MRSSRLLLVLGLLVAAAAAAFAFILISQSTGTTNPQQVQATPTPPDVEVLVARRDLPAGTIISDTSDLFKVVPIPAVDFEQGNYVHAAQASSITAKKLLTPLNQNDPLQVEQLGPLGLAEKIPAGRRAYPIKVNLLMGVGDLISEGDRIDVLVSFPMTVLYIRPGITTGADGSIQLQLKEDTTLDTTTKTVLQDIQVLRILRRPAAPPAATCRRHACSTADACAWTGSR
ncbi:MAG: hypothetical protein KatS3mg057_2045 [Herpetosiphonaceae bacterium]|nr:MAG: hypothetical protein KatS3mg057_2045 [Herpetosiphonaceae bacterium]